MSDRGSILISTANDIGEALVEKLGGEGYAPSVWDKEYNKLGIAEVDSAPALSVLEDSSETGTARGSILMSTANAIGAMLNKKYNTDRGFKPKEWASAASKLAPLPQKSAESASICSIEDGADDVPTKSLVVTIPPTLTGISSVTETQTGKNLIDLSSLVDGYVNSNGTFNTNHTQGEMRSDFIPVLPNTVYYFSIVETTGTAEAWVGIGEYTDTNASSFVKRDGYWRFTTSATTKYVVVSARNLAQATKIQLEIGNDTTTWEEYTPIEQYTASLGRTIYGGSADIVNGLGSDSYDKGSMSSTYLSGLNSDYIGYEASTAYFGGHPSVWVRNWNYSRAKARQSGGIGCACNYFPISMHNTTIFSAQYRIYFDVNGKNISSVADFIAFVANLEANNESLDIVYELNDTYTTDFTFTGQEVPTRLGYNAFWNDSGNTAVEYYKAPTPYTRKTATGGIANFSDQRTDLPLTKAIANISPSIAGKSAVNLVRAGKNLLPNKSYLVGANTLWLGDDSSPYYQPLKAGAYTVSLDTSETMTILLYENDSWIDRKYNATTATFVIDHDGSFAIQLYKSAGIPVINNWQLEIGSTASAYAPYQDPTTYTAELGETVYGGSVDFVSGEVKQVVKKKTISSFSGTYGAVNNGYAYYVIDADTTHNIEVVNPSNMIANQLFTYGNASRGNAPTWQYGGNDGSNQTHTFILPSEYDTLTKANNFLANLETPLEVTLTLATPTESTIPGRVISPIEGVNNLWNNAGGDTDVEYFEQE